jgi:hypothetical protein
VAHRTASHARITRDSAIVRAGPADRRARPGARIPAGVADREVPDLDLRTANLLAVRSPGRTGIIDDRSTLANLLPRLLRAYTGTGPPDVPETTFAWTGNPATSFFQRPD